jgi:OOP family OmpA-OmpF porin
LNDLLDQIAVSSLSVQINGHTDSVGNPTSNLALSKARAEAVKEFLMANAGSNFPAERITTRGYGDTQPIGTNEQNRRVEIILFSTK